MGVINHDYTLKWRKNYRTQVSGTLVVWSKKLYIVELLCRHVSIIVSLFPGSPPLHALLLMTFKLCRKYSFPLHVSSKVMRVLAGGGSVNEATYCTCWVCCVALPCCLFDLFLPSLSH